MSSTNRIIMTGGTGFVGSWMEITKPDRLKNQLLILDRAGYDLDYLETLQNINYIIHLAPTHPARVVRAAKRLGARLLYCSSGIAYNTSVDSEYRYYKLESENYCFKRHDDTVIARLFTFFGKGLDENKAITQFFKAAREGKPLKVWGDGSTVRTYMHGAEMGREMWRILFNGKPGHTYDVGSMQKTTIKRLAERIQAFTGCEIEYTDDKIAVKEYCPDGKHFLER